MFGNSCLTGLEYEATTAAIVMAGLFISFVIEFVVSRLLRWQQEKEATDGNAELTPIAIAKAETTNVTIMEAGIIFHSLCMFFSIPFPSFALGHTLADLNSSNRCHHSRCRRLILHHPLDRHYLPPAVRRYCPGYPDRLSRLQHRTH